jgi:hypothetical protein
LIPNGAKCRPTGEIKYRTVMAKEALKEEEEYLSKNWTYV